MIKDGSSARTADKFLLFNSSAASLVRIKKKKKMLLRAYVDWQKAFIPGTELQIYWQTKNTCCTGFGIIYLYLIY